MQLRRYPTRKQPWAAALFSSPLCVYILIGQRVTRGGGRPCHDGAEPGHVSGCYARGGKSEAQYAGEPAGVVKNGCAYRSDVFVAFTEGRVVTLLSGHLRLL